MILIIVKIFSGRLLTIFYIKTCVMNGFLEAGFSNKNFYQISLTKLRQREKITDNRVYMLKFPLWQVR